MKNLIILFALISLPVLALETATVTPPAPMATVTPISTAVELKKTVTKTAKKTAQKKSISKKSKARNACLKGNPSLGKHKKRLSRCIKRKMKEGV